MSVYLCLASYTFHKYGTKKEPKTLLKKSLKPKSLFFNKTHIQWLIVNLRRSN